MRSGAVSFTDALTTCSMSVMPPAQCRTFAFRDFMRVPSPAARMTAVNSICTLLHLLATPSALERQFNRNCRGRIRIVANFLGFLQQVSGDHVQAHLHQLFDV